MNLTQIDENIVRIKKSGEIIIPAKLREFFPWLNQDNLIEAKPTAQGLLLQPVNHSLSKNNDQGKKIEKARKEAAEFLEKFAENRKHDKHPKGSLTEFVIQDRHNH